ncbi:hypothetical protein ACFO1C_000015 [Photobacterium damselae]
MSSFILAIYLRFQLSNHALQIQRIQIHFKMHTYRRTNYAEYNQSLRDRGRIDIWLPDDITENWQTH